MRGLKPPTPSVSIFSTARDTTLNGQPRQGRFPGRGCRWCCKTIRQEEPVSRILSCAVIPLGAALPRALISDLPGGFGNCNEPPERIGQMRSAAWLDANASLPIWSCSVWGLPCPRRYRRSGALLPHHFTLTLALRPQAASGSPSRKRGSRGGIFSVALAVHGL